MLVQIHLRATKLSNISLSSWRRKKSNPYAKITVLSNTNTTAHVLGHTEIVYNTLSPVWCAVFTLEHDESAAWTPLRIGIYDSRSGDGRTSWKNSNESSVMPRRIEEAVPAGGDAKMGEVDLEVGDLLSGGSGEREFRLNEGGR
jgi:hypothetical protein